MASEINTLLESIEHAQCKMLRGLNRLNSADSVARHAHVDIYQSAIDQAYERLVEICGEKADGYVMLSLQWVEVEYQIEQARLRIKKHIDQYMFGQKNTHKLYSYSY